MSVLPVSTEVESLVDNVHVEQKKTQNKKDVIIQSIGIHDN